MTRDIGYTFETTAVRHESGHFHHFGIHPSFTSVYGNKAEDVLKVQCTIIWNESFYAREKETETGCVYWAWETDNRFTLIYPNYHQFSVCFPYSIEAMEEAQRGKAYILTVKEIK